MEIEFKNLDDRVDVIEHAVRSLKPEYSESEPSEHLQARLFVRDFEEDCVDYSISYYGEHGEFLGVDNSESVYASPSHDKSVTISLPMDIPEGASKAVVRFIFQDHVEAITSVYDYIFKAFWILGLLWLATTIFNSWR